jgi:S-adenosyl-L-methionine hydrolase (adenosine-forming)
MLVTLLSDFGTADFFAGAMRGAVLAADPQAQVVDITHDIPAHDIEAGAFTLAAAFGAFPRGTIHLAVVDPGVGSERAALVVEAAGHLFVGPDNGLFGHVYERAGRDPLRVSRLTPRSPFRPPPSATFHGRDVFAPVAGALSRGAGPAELHCEEVTNFVRLPLARPRLLPDGSREAAVIHIDRFGNLVTNLTPQDFADEDGLVLIVGGREVRRFRRFYAEEQGDTAEPFAIWGSAGFLEISVNLGSAALALGARRGQKITLEKDVRRGT